MSLIFTSYGLDSTHTRIIETERLTPLVLYHQFPNSLCKTAKVSSKG